MVLWELQHSPEEYVPVVVLPLGEQPLAWLKLKTIADVPNGLDVELLHTRIDIGMQVKSRIVHHQVDLLLPNGITY